MKKAILFLFVSVCFCNCSEKKESINFETLNETEFNAKPFEVPSGMVTDSLRQAHDSCMGFSFDANAILAQTRDSFFIGSIVNRQSLKIVNTIRDLGLTRAQLFSSFNILTNPCYEKRVLHFPLKSVLGGHYLQFPGADEALNKEINDAIAASADAEMQTGSWVYLDMKDALKNIMDTTNNPGGLRYRENLLDTSNMVLTATESITNISFMIHTGKDISEPLQAFLKNRPTASQPTDPPISVQLFYIDGSKFQITFSGFFPAVGKFMKVVLK